MTSNRNFHTYNGKKLFTLSFYILEGLMQGTVNSPILFNIYTSEIPNLFGLNGNNGTYSTAFADDFIISVASKNPTKIQKKLTGLMTGFSNAYKQ